MLEQHFRIDIATMDILSRALAWVGCHGQLRCFMYLSYKDTDTPPTTIVIKRERINLKPGIFFS